jgi:hypothetical protein
MCLVQSVGPDTCCTMDTEPVPALQATTPRTAGKRSSASFGELGGLSPRGGGSKARGAYSQPGTPRSEVCSRCRPVSSVNLCFFVLDRQADDMPVSELSSVQDPLQPEDCCSMDRVRRQCITCPDCAQALVLEELKALIGQLDPATKTTMKNSLYRISRNAAVSVLRAPTPLCKHVHSRASRSILDRRSKRYRYAHIRI